MSIEKLSDELLIATYHHAKKLELDPQFIKLLKFEIKKRGIHSLSESSSSKDKFDGDRNEE